ncbi:MAG: tRNA-dihydrouridine synthase, partial [Bacilli bacterium]
EIIQKTNVSFDFIDINLGCPVPKVTKTGAGSSWLKKPQMLEEYVKQIVVFSPKPVTAKIRLGWDEKSINFLSVVESLQNAGVVAITVHARTTKQMYTGKADWKILEGLKEIMKVPLIISGDIFTLDDAISALKITNADAVMVARGAIGKPRLIEQINTYLETGVRLSDAKLSEQIEYLKKYADLLIAEKGENQAMMILRGIAPRFFNGYPGMKGLKNVLSTNLTMRADLDNVLNGIK